MAKLRRAKYTTDSLFDAIIARIKEKGDMPKDLELDYIQSRSWTSEELRTYEFSNVSTVDFGGCEGIYCNFAIRLRDNGTYKDVHIGTAKTLSADLNAMRKMGELLGVFAYHLNKFVDENIDDFSYTGFKVCGKDANYSYETATMERATLRANELASKYGEATITDLATGETTKVYPASAEAV